MVLFDRLASRDLLSFVRQLGGGVDSELKKWERKLKMIQAVLNDAEEKQLTDEAVKTWLDDLQDLAYDAEDILDEFATQALESKLMAQNQDSSGQLLSFIPVSLNPNAVRFNYGMRSKINDITSRLEQHCKDRIELGLQRIPEGASSTAAAAHQRPPSSSVPPEREVFGREEDKAKILDMVLADSPSDLANFVVIPIVGMGGIGKTTLAREVYNDKAVGDSKFDVKAWVCVSDVFDVLGISKALLESITRRPCLLNSLNEVQVELKVAVDKKRFLLVLDDVWNEDYSLWVDLKAPFLGAAPNSKMIVTTRNSSVASTMRPIDRHRKQFKYYDLKSLLDDDCWSIFINNAFESTDLSAHRISESFREKVVGKCGGLPLAAKTLGGLLRTKTHAEWDGILDSKIWDLPRQSSILPVLRLSYHHLPSHLKRCFAFCAIFPKDYAFTERELTFLWMAGGIIRQSRNNEQLEDLGSKCFGDLVSRSIFQQTAISDSSKFVMHDLIHDLAELVSGETIFRLEEANTLSRSFERVRHSSYACGEYDGKNMFEVFNEIEHLRTFLPLRLRIRGTFYITRTVLSDLLPKFKKLRMLSLEGYCIGELPIPFEDLRLLRFLNLADTDIRSLPESTCKLLNLEILILRNCSLLIKLPPKMRNLINLRHLDLRGAKLLKEMPVGMKELKKLQTLYNFIVGKGETASGLEDLKSLNFLCDELCIVGLENVNNPQNAREAALCEKRNLEALTLDWGSQFDNSRDGVVEEDVLEILQPHKCIKKVAIRNYGGARFPHWIGDPLFSKIEFLELENCDNCASLPSLGRLRSKINDITSRLEQLCQERIELGLQRITGEASSTAAAAHLRPPSSSVPTEREVFGREEDKAKILDMVLADAPSDHANFVVIPIVGMGGIGKTTLAREVYNDKAVGGSKFDVKAWVCVSDVFDVLGISKALLESITRRPCLLNSLNEVQVELKVAVDKKRFLLVLDDVWNEEYSLWVDLKAPFLAAAPNSKMIVTTRNSNVASTMGPVEHYNLRSLSDDDCWSIFIKHAFESRDLNAHQISESFRKKVVAKCGGLALAAKTLGGLLRTTRHDAWDDILESKIWDLPRQSGVLPVLRLSYHHLPSHLKRCFAFCAIFPKDYEFTEKELTFLWMAGGIIRQSRNNEQLEDLGSQCFGDLVSRSIFQQTTISDSSKFVMHDLIHDLAELVSGGTIFRLEKSPNLSSSGFERVRHSSYAGGLHDGKNKFEVFYEIEHLRTFLPLRLRIRGTFYITRTVLSDLLPKFKKLRMLSLEGYCIGELPIPFEDLRLLRFLNLADTDIRSLPESTCKLLNLEILILRNCSRLIKLPPKMRNLINLRHLDIRGAELLKEMPFGMKELKKLQILYNFIVGKGETACGLEELKSLNFLCDELCIAGLENVNNPQNAREAALCEKHNLEALTLEWGSQSDSPRDAVLEENVLDTLQPHKRIKELAIRHYGGARFSLWIGDPSFSEMKVLKLENCDNCVSLPSLGLLSSLKHLAVKGLKKLKSIESEVYGEGFSMPFPSLGILSFENLPEWEHWDTEIKGNAPVDIFPRLQELSIAECPKLSGQLPELLPSLETLVVSKCEKLVVPLSSYPMLCRLEVDECKELVCGTLIDFKLIKSMTISNSSLDMNGRKGMLYDGLAGSSLPKPMTTTNVLEFGKLLKPGFQILEILVIGNSEQLKSWRQHGDWSTSIKPVQGLNMLAHNEEVSIEESCVRLVLFPEINFFPRNLRSLLINNNTAFKSLPEEMMENNSQLERLYIKDCDSLTFIARRRLPASLKRLEIENCEKLQRLFDDEEDASSSSRASSSSPVMLQHLIIENCPELTSLSSGVQFLEALEYLEIRDCPKLESIPDGLHNLKCLQSIYIRKCPSLVSFPERGLPNTISRVDICSCDKLEALPNDLHKLNSLRGLSIQICPNLVSFPEEGFPTNLTSLTIGYFKMYKTLVQWGLHRLTSLRDLWIVECDDEAECFPDEEIGMTLPASLTHLHLDGFQNLISLSSTGFQSLTSLQSLWIWDCPNLTSFPEVGLPSSLLELHIRDCPKLKKACKRDQGKELPKIAHIPCVEIDGKFIYDPESEE